MSHSNIQHRRTHNLLLISKLLNQRDAASPFTLVCDTLEQTAKPLIREYTRRANLAKTYIIFLGFETSKAPAGIDRFIPCYNKTPAQISQTLSSAVRESSAKRHLILIDSLHPLCTLSLQASPAFDLTSYLTSLILPPKPSTPSTSTISNTSTLVAVCHTDIPLPLPTTNSQYTPDPLSLLRYLSTTLITTHSLAHHLSQTHYLARSQQPPAHGLDAHAPGILIGQPPAKWTTHLLPAHRGVILELEHRRKSGRGVREAFFLPSSPVPAGSSKEPVTLLDDHPLLRGGDSEAGNDDGALEGLTFRLGLTERQRAERDGVVLPYFDAQKGGGAMGPGEGGRILYDMGSEDDFDEEEDEI